jgi:hypothetical protein
MTLTYQPGFLHYFFIFKQLYKTILFKTVYTSGKEKTGILCSGRLKTLWKPDPFPQQEYFVQEYIIQGITHTRTVIYGRSVLNKGRFVLAPRYVHRKAKYGNVIPGSMSGDDN